MTMLSRAARAFFPLALLLPAPAFAQSACTMYPTAEDTAPQYSAPADPWIFRGTDIPVDRYWLMGELPNGVRYAVRQNGVPPCQVSMRVIVDAGSLNETDAERGYAHLIEHLIFRQSRDFAPGEAIPYFQRLGAALGFDTNATTSPTQTIYQLDLPNANRTSLADAVRRFSGMVREPALSAENIAADLPIVLAERRDSAGADARIADATRETLFAGQLLAERGPIGTLETLEAATPQAVQAFHRRWYRPQNTVVVLVGDADPRVLAAMVEREFADWTVPGALAPAPDFGNPVAPASSLSAASGPPVGEVAVVVEPGQPRNLTFAILRPWQQVTDSIEYNRGILTDQLATAIINRRLENRAREGGSFLFATVAREKISRSVDGTFVTLTPLTADWQTALADVRGVIADALVNPPSQAEIDREVAQFDIAFVNGVEQSRIQAGSQLADSIGGALDIREAVASPQTFLDVFRSLGPRLTPDTLLAHAQALFRGEVVRAVLLTPDAGGTDAAALQAALAAPAIADARARDEGTALSFADLPPIGIAAEPVLRSQVGPYGMEQVEFANGVRALLYGRDNEPGRVTVRLRFGAGWRGIALDEGPYAQLGQMALVTSGIGPLDQNDLDRIANGRRLGFTFRIEEGTFEFEGQTRAEDLEAQLWLFAAKLAMPRWDAAPVERARASAQLAYDSYNADAAGVINRDLDWLLHDRDPRFASSDPAALAAVTPERFAEVWGRLLAQGPVEVAVFGDIDHEPTIAALSRTFGALAPRAPLAADAAPAARFPAGGGAPLVLNHNGDPDQAAAVIAWPTGGGSGGISESRRLDILAQLLATRLTDELRERVGAAYSPIVASDWPLDTPEGGRLFALVQLQPALVPAFYSAVDEIVADLAQNGPTADELARTAEPMRQYITRARTGHTFWLNQVEGAAFDPARIAALGTLERDFTTTTPADIQDLAARYLAAHPGFRLSVVAADAQAAPVAVGR